MGANTKLLSVNEAAASLGVSHYAIRQWIFHKQIEFVKVGFRVLIKQETIDKIIEAGTVQAISDRRIV
jgi:excisionase family DNA binding protein